MTLMKAFGRTGEPADAEKRCGTFSTPEKKVRSRWPWTRSSELSIRPDDWMSHLADDVPLSALTVPGTHDSAAYTYSWPFVATQTMDIQSQLDHGIRYFDLRCGIRDDIVQMVHGPTYLGLELRTVLDSMYTWLATHPSEALIVQIKRDRLEERSTVHFAQAIFKVLAQKSERWRTANTIPNLGDLRGRIQLFRRFGGPSLDAYGMNVTRWQDNPLRPFTIYTRHCVQITIQDHYSFPDAEPLPSLITKKGGDVAELLNRADADEDLEKHWYINFTSAYEFNFYYQLTPREVAVGSWWGFRWEEGMNVRLRTYLREKKGAKRRFGIVAMDFPELGPDDLVSALIRTNFEPDSALGKYLVVLFLFSAILLICWLASG